MNTHPTRAAPVDGQDDCCATPLISVRDLTLQADGHVVGRHLCWTLHTGERWAILGPTGSGKSLFVATLAGRGLLPTGDGPDRPIRYHFLESTGPIDRGRLRRAIAYVAFDKRPGSSALFHQARWHASIEVTSPTVADFLSRESVMVRAGRSSRSPFEVTASPPGEFADEHDPSFEARQSQVVAGLELGPLLDRRLHQLSDGEWRRVQIAEAVLTSPHVLILDDPFTGLDKHFRARLRRLISNLLEGEIQVIIVASTPEEIPESVTHVLVMDRGEIRAQGPRAPILAAYRGPCEAAGLPSQTPAAAECEEAPPIIEMHDVTVVHDNVDVLREINWTVRRGEKWGLIGHNGAGKTTLLSLILGDHPQAYANHIALFGRTRGSGESIWEIKRRIGWVAPELHRYHPPLSSAFDVVCSGFFDTLGLHRPCSPQQQAQARQWMARLGLAGHATQAFRSLPRGEQRLILIARALVKEPELLILDEPCQGLDDAQKARVLAALDEITASPDITMVYVTHRPQEFPHTLTHVMELKGGKVVRQVAL